MGNKWRAHSPEYTINHIKHLTENYGVCHIHFEDDNFTFKRSRVNDICRRMISGGIRVTWDTPNGVRADTLNDELLGNMKESGCIGLTVAAESGDQDVVNNIIKKKLDLANIKHAAALAHKHGIPMGCFFVIGFPGEKKENIKKTLDFAIRLLADHNCHPILNVATPLPGTELARVARDKGYLVREMSPGNLARATDPLGLGMIETSDFDSEYLRRCCARLQYRYRLIRTIFLLKHSDELYQAIRRRVLRLGRNLPSSIYRLKRIDRLFGSGKSVM